MTVHLHVYVLIIFKLEIFNVARCLFINKTDHEYMAVVFLCAFNNID